MKIKLYTFLIVAIFCALNKLSAESFYLLETIDATSIKVTSEDFIFLGVLSSSDDPFLARVSEPTRASLVKSIKAHQLVIYTYGNEVTAVRDDINLSETSVFLDGYSQRKKPFNPLLIYFYSINKPSGGQLVYYVRGASVFDATVKKVNP